MQLKTLQRPQRIFHHLVTPDCHNKPLLSLSSTSLPNHSQPSSLSHLGCQRNQYPLVEQWPTCSSSSSSSSSQPTSSSPLFPIDKYPPTPPIHCSPLRTHASSQASHLKHHFPSTLPAPPNLQLYNYLLWYHYALALIPSMMTHNSISAGISTSTNATTSIDTASSLIISNCSQTNTTTTNGESNENQLHGGGIGYEATPGEVNDGEADVEGVAPTWKCEVCAKTYKSSASLRVHRRCHTRPWRCCFCDKSPSRKWLLRGHERTHTGEKSFVRPTCQRAFADHSNLHVHM